MLYLIAFPFYFSNSKDFNQFCKMQIFSTFQKIKLMSIWLSELGQFKFGYNNLLANELNVYGMNFDRGDLPGGGCKRGRLLSRGQDRLLLQLMQTKEKYFCDIVDKCLWWARINQGLNVRLEQTTDKSYKLLFRKNKWLGGGGGVCG